MSLTMATLRPPHQPPILSRSSLSPSLHTHRRSIPHSQIPSFLSFSITPQPIKLITTHKLKWVSTNFPGFLPSGSFAKAITYDSSSITTQSIKPINTHKLKCFSTKFPGFLFSKRIGVVSKAVNGEDESKGVDDKAEEDARGQSTMPDRFRYLTKEAPEKPVRWPWFVALAFLLYAWRTVLWELYNWRKATATLSYILGYISKLALALIFHFIGNPITSIIQAFETMLYSIRAFYSSVISYTPVPELTILIILVSTVLAIAEASVPDSVESQPYLLSLAGVIGYAAVKGSISELFFWTLLFGLFSFARFVKRRDYVSSALPVAAVLAGVGEPWVRFVVMTSFLALAITQHAKRPIEYGESEDADKGRKIPVPLLFAGLAIGVRIAAKWAGYRHLTWMIV